MTFTDYLLLAGIIAFSIAASRIESAIDRVRDEIKRRGL